mgnify:CR=1 FL=1
MITSYKYDGDPLRFLAHTVEFRLRSTEGWDFDINVLSALMAVTEFIHEFPDWEVDRLFAQELRKRIPNAVKAVMALRDVVGPMPAEWTRLFLWD